MMMHRVSIAAVIALGAMLRFYHLAGSRFVWPDEYRALSPLNIKVPFFNVVYSLPMVFSGTTMETVLFTSAALGVLTLLFFYRFANSTFGKEEALASTLLLAVSGIHIYFSRLGYPVALEVLLSFLMVVFLCRTRERKSPIDIALGGLFFSLSLLTYIPAYSLAFGVVALVWEKGRGFKNLGVFSLSALASGVGIISAALLLSTGTLDYGQYIAKLGSFQESTASYIALDVWGALQIVWSDLAYFWGVVPSVLSLLAVVYFLLRREGIEFQLALYVFLSLIFYLTLATCGFHTLFVRQLLHFVPLLCLLLGLAVIRLLNQRVIVSAVLILAMSYRAFFVPSYAFKIDSILGWLEENQISKSQIVTELDLYEAKSAELPWRVPLSNQEIEWTRLENLFREKGVRYILTSGIGSAARVGAADAKLSQASVLASWSHPYTLIRPHKSEKYRFHLYELTEELFED